MIRAPSAQCCRKRRDHSGNRVPGSIRHTLLQDLISAMDTTFIEPRTALSTAMVEGYAAKEEIKEAAMRIAHMASGVGLLLPGTESGGTARTMEEHNNKST